MIRKTISFLAMTIFAAAGLTVHAATIYYAEDFTGTNGTDPAGWTDVSGKYAISSNDYLASGLSGGSSAIAHFNAGTNTDGWADYADYVVTAKFTGLNLNNGGDAGGILGRVVDNDSYYHLRYRREVTNSVQLYRFDSGADLLNETAVTLDFDSNDYYYRLTFEGTSIHGQIATDAAFSNLVYDHTATDSTLASGGVGLRLYDNNPQGATMLVEDIMVTGIPEPTSLALLGLGGVLIALRPRRT